MSESADWAITGPRSYFLSERDARTTTNLTILPPHIHDHVIPARHFTLLGELGQFLHAHRSRFGPRRGEVRVPCWRLSRFRLS